jgi:hypothetical protein
LSALNTSSVIASAFIVIKSSVLAEWNYFASSRDVVSHHFLETEFEILTEFWFSLVYSKEIILSLLERIYIFESELLVSCWEGGIGISSALRPPSGPTNSDSY